MQYLVLAADYLDYSLREVDGDQIDRDQLPMTIREALAAWNAKYQRIIPMSMSARVEVADVISDLDTEGLSLAKRIASAIGDCKVTYYSEGNLRFA
jgi:hypothetical protein